MIGSNSADFVGFISADTKEALFAQFGEWKAQAKAAYDPDGTAELWTRWSSLANDDFGQAEPARFTANAFAANGAPGLRLSLLLRPRCDAGAVAERRAPHGAEIPYAFDTLAAGRGLAPPRRPRTRRSPGWSTPTGPTSPRRATRMVRACRNGRVTIPARTRSSSSGPTARPVAAPIPGKRGWT